MQTVNRRVAAVVRVPVNERDVLGGDFHKPSTGFNQSFRQQTPLAEPPRVVLLEALLRFERDIKGFAFLRTQQAVGVVESLEHGLLLVVGQVVPLRAAVVEFAEELVTALEAAGLHVSRGAHGLGGLVGVGQVHRAELAAEETGLGESLDLLVLADALQPLADVDEWRDHRVLRTEHLRHPRTNVRTRHRLRWDVTGVPVVLVSRMQDRSEVRLVVRSNQRASVHHTRDPFQSLADLDVVDGGVDSRERADDVFHRRANLERHVAFGVEGFRGRHAASHPDQDHRIGGGFRMLDLVLSRSERLGLASHQCGGRACRELLQEMTSSDGLVQFVVVREFQIRHQTLHGSRTALSIICLALALPTMVCFFASSRISRPTR